MKGRRLPVGDILTRLAHPVSHLHAKSWHINFFWIIFAFALLCTSLSSPTRAQEETNKAEIDLALEQEILDRLAQLNLNAVPIFQDASKAMESEDWTTAKRGFERVLELVPDFPDALMRLIYTETQLGNLEGALKHARKLYDNDPSAFNRALLANAMLHTGDYLLLDSALDHARAAAEVLPDDEFVQGTLFWAGVQKGDRNVTRKTSQKLIQLLPDFAPAHYYAAMVYAYDGKWEEAERHLLKSKELGMDAETVEAALQEGVRTQARLRRWGRRGLYSLGVWLAGLAGLFIGGMLLSKLTLSMVHRSQAAAGFEIGKGERFIRNIYRVVIAVTSLSFYISIPLLIAVVVAVTGGIFYMFLSIGRIPIRIAIIVGITAIVTLYAIIRSVFARIRDADPGRPLAREEAPRLWALTQEVAERVDTRPVEAIYLTPGTEIAVIERGGMWRKFQNKGRRCLILGLGALQDLPQSQFVAILAHEYGHFSNRDTAGGNLANHVLYSMHRMALGLIQGDLARWYNPAWLFVNGFNRIFLIVTLGASRLQEILADRFAAMAYGVQNFANGLKHVIRQSLIFDMQVNNEIQSAQDGGRRLNNAYTLPPPEADHQKKELEYQLNELMTRPTSPYDSHPVPQDRIALLEKLNIDVSADVSSDLVWDLFPDPAALQAEMTGFIQLNVDEYQAMVEAHKRAMEEGVGEE